MVAWPMFWGAWGAWGTWGRGARSVGSLDRQGCLHRQSQAVID